MASTVFTLRSKGPTDLERCIQPVTESQSDRAAFDGRLLYRAVRISGVPIILRAHSPAGDEVEFLVSPAADNGLPPDDVIIAALRRKFHLDLDLPAFYRFTARIPLLHQLPHRQNGLRPIIKDSLLEALCLAVIDQQVNVTFAARLKHRLLEACGSLYRVDGHDLWLFPSAEELAFVEPEKLHRLQLSRSKSDYIINLARRFSAEPEWESAAGADEEIVERLCTLRGVGRWTAEYAAMMGLGLLDTLPAADIGLMRMVQRVYGLTKRPTETQVRKIGRDWSPWRGLVTFYLWHWEDSENAAATSKNREDRT